MIIEDLWTAPGPSTWDLYALERLARRRAAIEAIEPDGEEQERIRAYLLTAIDLMEECLCEEGRHAALVASGWQELDALEPRLTTTSQADSGEATNRKRRARSRQGSAGDLNQRVPHARETRRGRRKPRATASTRTRAQEARS